MACGVFISSVKFSGQTCQVTFLDASSNLTYQLGEETIPFTYYPPDNSPQGTYFIYFSGTDTTYPLVVSGSCPTPHLLQQLLTLLHLLFHQVLLQQ